MIVKLSLLDKIGSKQYNSVVQVVESGRNYEVIGTCEIFRDDSGQHFGKLSLDRPVDENRYFYYTNLVSNDGVFYFSGLNFTDFEKPNHPTPRLKDMIVYR